MPAYRPHNLHIRPPDSRSEPYSDQFPVSRSELQDFVAKWQKYEREQEEAERRRSETTD